MQYRRPWDQKRPGILPESPGFRATLEPPCQATADDYPLVIAGWITEDLLRETQEVWSGIYGYRISPADAVEILTNVKNLAECLLSEEEEDGL